MKCRVEYRKVFGKYIHADDTVTPFAVTVKRARSGEETVDRLISCISEDPRGPTALAVGIAAFERQ